MKFIKFMTVTFFILAFSASAWAQESTVNYFFTACETSAIVEVDGTMGAGYDLYVQFFNGAAGVNGDALTPLTRLSVNGTYDITRVVNYSSGKIAALGQLVSMTIFLAPEGNPDAAVYTDTIDDFQDTCGEAGADVQTIGGGDAIASDGLGLDPRTGETVNVPAGELIVSSGIPKPDGGILNEIYALPGENIVQIGARYTERITDGTVRMPDAGLIYAECNNNTLAAPGILYDTDALTVYWNWWAVTAEQVYDHMRNASYWARVEGQDLTVINVTPVIRRDDGYYYVFYTAPLGDGWKPGNYSVILELRWQEPITDGVNDYGPGTETDVIITVCDFTVAENPYGVEIQQINPTSPIQNEFRPENQ